MQDFREPNSKYVVKCEHADIEDISSVAQILKDRTTSDSTSVSIVYLFKYYEANKYLGKIYTSYDDLNGIVLCDHSILRRGPFDDVINKMVDCYEASNFEYGCEFDIRGLVVKVKGWLFNYDDREMSEAFDDWKNVEYEQALAPYIRTKVEYIISRILKELEKEKKKSNIKSILDIRLDIHESFQLIDIIEEFHRESELKDEE